MDVLVEAGSSSEAVPDGVGLEMCGIAYLLPHVQIELHSMFCKDLRTSV